MFRTKQSNDLENIGRKTTTPIEAAAAAVKD